METLAGGRYRVERELGRGGMAAVYLARDEELDRPVALKVLAGHLAGESDFRERFLREAQMAARLSHPNIVQVFDAGEEDARPYIVMEYVPGTTLAEERARRERLEPARVVDLALQICGGLEHAHAAGLVHRDVKPQNLLVREDGVVKIADFGIARAAESTRMTQVGSVLGTAAYLSPEQAAGEEVSAAADLYSLGAVLYELLTGRTPYRFETLPELVVKHQQEPIQPLRELEPAVPEALEAAVMRCLARNPAYRPASAAELAHALAVSSPEPPTQPLPPATGLQATDVVTRPLERPVRRDFAFPASWRMWGALVAAALVAAAVLVGVALLDGDGGGEPAAPARAPVVEPVPAGETPAERARNLAEWLRANAG